MAGLSAEFGAEQSAIRDAPC